MKRNGMALIAAVLVLVATVALGQPAPGGPGGPPPGPGAGPGTDGALARFLGLTDAQLASWKTFHEELKATADALIEQRKAIMTQLQTALAATSPDAAAVGQLVISVKKVDDQLRAANEALDVKLESVLTSEQMLKFEAFRAAQQAMQGPGPGSAPGSGPGF